MSVQSPQGRENNENSTKMVEVKEGEKIQDLEVGIIYCFPQNIILSQDNNFNIYLRDCLKREVSKRSRK
jgi:hypothetical protein